MEDSLSVKSNESIATSDEFDFVCDKPGSSKTPTLNVANGDLDELKKKLTEVLQEQEPTTSPHKEMETIKQCNDNESTRTHTVVGQSKFYDCQNVEQGEDALSANTSPSIEKQDIMKPELSSESDEEGKFSHIFFTHFFHCCIFVLYAYFFTSKFHGAL